jgi:hypothetical protein
MKKSNLFKGIAIIMVTFFVFSIQGIGQGVNPDDPQYQVLKEQGLLPQPPAVNYNGPYPDIQELQNPNRACLLVPLDGSFTAFAANDDLSVGPINLGFTFDFYGTAQTQVYINNNGNVSFGDSYSTYTPTGFPVSGFPMIAPFWGDVDTRGIGSGLCYYKLESNRLIVTWDAVGYYNSNVDKLNTFQLIITDGTDPLVGIGNNVAFAYDDMQWTTGDVSGGTGGFGGSPATVGINKGDGVDFALIGLFDHPGTDYDGPGGLNDGVDWLDCKAFAFDASGDDPNLLPGYTMLGSTGQINSLLAIDPVIAASNFLFPHGAFGPVTEIELRSDGVLFGATGGGSSNIITIDYLTGVETLVGTHVFGGVNALEFVGDVLYGVYIPNALQPSQLVTVNQVTGALTVIGPTGIGPIGGMAYDPASGIMYGATSGGAGGLGGNLVTINLATGAASVVGPVGFFNVTALEFSPDNGILYGGVSYAATQSADLITIDPNTGAGTLVGPIGYNGLSGLAFVDQIPINIPISNWAIVIGIILIITVAVIRFRRMA